MTRKEIDAKLDTAISGLIDELRDPDDVCHLAEALLDMTTLLKATIIMQGKEAGLAAVGSIDIPEGE